MTVGLHDREDRCHQECEDIEEDYPAQKHCEHHIKDVGICRHRDRTAEDVHPSGECHDDCSEYSKDGDHVHLYLFRVPLGDFDFSRQLLRSGQQVLYGPSHLLFLTILFLDVPESVYLQFDMVGQFHDSIERVVVVDPFIGADMLLQIVQVGREYGELVYLFLIIFSGR